MSVATTTESSDGGVNGVSITGKRTGSGDDGFHFHLEKEHDLLSSFALRVSSLT